MPVSSDQFDNSSYPIRGRGERNKLKGKDPRKKEQAKVRLLAMLLGLNKKEAGEAIHQTKKEAGLGGQDNLYIDPNTGDISHKGEDLTD